MYFNFNGPWTFSWTFRSIIGNSSSLFFEKDFSDDISAKSVHVHCCQTVFLLPVLANTAMQSIVISDLPLLFAVFEYYTPKV